MIIWCKSLLLQNVWNCKPPQKPKTIELVKNNISLSALISIDHYLDAAQLFIEPGWLAAFGYLAPDLAHCTIIFIA